MRKFAGRLSVRLFLLLLLLGNIIFIPMIYFILKVNQHYLIDQVIANADQANNLIQASTHYSMLHNRKEDVTQIIQTLGQEPGVEGIRIYNKKGVIVYSTDAADVGKIVDVKAEQCTVCHATSQPLTFLPSSTRPRIFQSASGARVVGMIKPIPNEAACGAGGCHPPPEEQKILGVLDAKMSLTSVDSHIAASRQKMIMYAVLGIVLIEFFTGLFLWILVHRRLKRLSEGFHQVMLRNLNYRLSVRGQDEFAELAQSFNSMLSALQHAEAANQEWAQTLEYKVAQKTKELEQAQQQMVHVAKMASMGKLAATVAHEINNPLSGILTYSKLLLRRIQNDQLSPEERQTIANQLTIVINEIKRCGAIVKNMLLFAKGAGFIVEDADLHAVVEKSLFIINHHLEINGIHLVKELSLQNPVIRCSGNHLQQALIAMFINSVEAMTPGGTLTIGTEDVPDRDAVRIRVADTGKGIAPEQLEQIFEPFFTTKEGSPGVGLGLAVVYGIIQQHQGTIEVQSELDRGTTFIITLPRHPAPAKIEAAASGDGASSPAAV